jgi:hypothetical protein
VAAGVPPSEVILLPLAPPPSIQPPASLQPCLHRSIPHDTARSPEQPGTATTANHTALVADARHQVRTRTQQHSSRHAQPGGCSADPQSLHRCSAHTCARTLRTKRRCHTAAAARPVVVTGRARCVRSYSLLGGLFGKKEAAAPMGGGSSKEGGWAPATGVCGRGGRCPFATQLLQEYQR